MNTKQSSCQEYNSIRRARHCVSSVKTKRNQPWLLMSSTSELRSQRQEELHVFQGSLAYRTETLVLMVKGQYAYGDHCVFPFP